MPTYLSTASLKAYLRIQTSDTIDDALLDSVVSAVEAQQRNILRPDAFQDPQVNPLDSFDTTTPPTPPVYVPPPWIEYVGDTDEHKVAADVYEAALLRGARLYARRASPEGLVPFGDLGVARIPGFDRDIDKLEGPWRVVVLS